MTTGRIARIAVIASVMLATPLHADVLVISSNTPDLKPGMQLADSQQIEVPAGASIRVMLPSGATLQIKGATTRQVKEITKGEPIVEAVWSKAKELFATGGVDQSRVGATRSFKAVTKPAPFVWNVLLAGSSGNFCILKGEAIALERPAGVSEVTVTDPAGGKQARIAFAGDAKQASWPADVQPAHDGVYQIITGAGSRQIRLRLIENSAASDDRAIAALIANDCLVQAKSLALQ